MLTVPLVGVVSVQAHSAIMRAPANPKRATLSAVRSRWEAAAGVSAAFCAPSGTASSRLWLIHVLSVTGNTTGS